jgi:hypothetical protein
MKKKSRWFTKKTNGRYYCLMCQFNSHSFLGITSHIRKHKNDRKKLGLGQRTLEGEMLVE